MQPAADGQAHHPARILRLKWIPLLLLVLLSAGCERHEHLDRIKARGTLIALSQNAATTVYEGRDGPTGFEYDLLADFAEYLGVQLHVTYKEGMNELLDAIEGSNGDVAAANLTRLPERELRVDFGPAYYQVEQQLVCRRGRPIPENLNEMNEHFVLVLSGSSYEIRMRELAAQYPDLKWGAIDGFNTQDLLELVWKRQVACTVADSHIVARNQRYYPELQVAFAISEKQDLGWALPKGSKGLRLALNNWFKNAMQRDFFTQMEERYFSHVEEFDYVDVRRFIRRIDSRLPRYEKIFREAAEKYDLDWQLLAALSYQESHWNPRATSPTGVRGMMMLTLPTARMLKVSNRLDPRASIMGGAKYLSRLRARLPIEITEPDRTWVALAAYNVGNGHIADARKLAMRFNQNPNQWQVLKDVLPLLSDRNYYRSLEFGYARGSEPVQYVQRIRDYHDLMRNQIELRDGPQFLKAPAFNEQQSTAAARTVPPL
jgi:membrane-bound lytic murein transglycosylase F